MSISKRFLFRFLVVFLFFQVTGAQNLDLKFEHFIDDKGLNQNTILDVVQDNEGFVWIATSNGLYMFDGQRFKVYRNQINESKSIVNNMIMKLEIDDANNLWIGTVRGLCAFNTQKQEFFYPSSTLINKDINAIYLDKSDGSLWVGTNDSGLYHILNPNVVDGGLEHFTFQSNDLNTLNSNIILSIAKDQYDNLWVGTDAGLNKMFLSSKDTKKFLRVEGFDKSIGNIFMDSKKGLWVGESGTGLWKLSGPSSLQVLNKNSFINYELGLDVSDNKYGNINDIEEDVDGKLWVGVYGYGLYQLNVETGGYSMYAPSEIHEESLSNKRIMTILIDRTRVLWVGTEVGGLNKCDLQKKDIIHIDKNKLNANSLSHASVNAILEDGDFLWVGTEYGLNRIGFRENYKSPQIEHYFFKQMEPGHQEKGQSVKAIYKDSDGLFWLGKDRIVTMHVKNGNVNFKDTDLNIPNVFSILEDKKGFLWFGSFSDGLVKWKKKTNGTNFDFSNVTHYKSNLYNDRGIKSNYVSCLYEDSKGHIWVGTLQGGLSLILNDKDGEKDQFITFLNRSDDSNSLSYNSVFSILEDKNGTYWIGTFGGGLNKLTFPNNDYKSPVFEHFSEADGLSNNAIYGILQDESGKLWMSTDNGISCFDPKNASFKNYNKGDGLQSNNFRKNAYYKSKSDYLFFGGLRGLNIFHPKSLTDNMINAEPKLTAFKIKNDIVEVGKRYNGRVILERKLSSNTHKPIQLKHHENTLTFEFAALHFAAPEKNKFQYQLAGFDKQWQDSKGLPFAHYTNLSPGNYTFKVKASNNDEIWNDVPTEFSFRINPPFWMSWWAFVLYIAIVFAILWSVQSYFDLRSKQRASAQIQKEIEQVNKLKLQFFTNISHEFKTPITLILSPIEELMENLADNLKVKSKLQIIQRNANSLLRLVNQLMEFRKIEVGETKLAATNSNLINFVREIASSFKVSAKKADIHISFETNLKSSEVWFDWDKLEKILNNLIYNAIKFTNPGGTINVRVLKSEEKDLIGLKDSELDFQYIKIEVEDNGVGIKDDELPFVFHRFYQVNQTRERMRKGTGIGLAITKDLVELHHGKISVKSKVEKGTKFTILLPLGTAHLMPEEMVLKTESMDQSLNSLDEHDEKLDLEANHSKKSKDAANTILIVDDNADIRQLIQEGFSNSYNVLEAENGNEGLKIALKEMPDLIVSDILMPEMDGIELCAALKSNLRTSHIPVILLTALNSVEHRIEGLESGADAYIPKPFKMKLLTIRIQKLIESRDALRKRFQTEKELTPETITLNSLDEEFLKKIMEHMEHNMGNDSYWIDELAADMNTSRSTFFRKLKKLTGQSPNDFIRLVRLKRAAQLLDQNELTIAQVSYRVGFSDPGYFGKCFRKVYGESPSSYSKKETV